MRKGYCFVNEINNKYKTRLMKDTEKRNWLKWNTMLWLVAMVLPAFFSIVLASAKFPWQMILPLLLIGPMLASNRMLAQAIGESTDTPKSN